MAHVVQCGTKPNPSLLHAADHLAAPFEANGFAAATKCGPLGWMCICLCQLHCHVVLTFTTLGFISQTVRGWTSQWKWNLTAIAAVCSFSIA